MNPVLFSSANDEWETPQAFFDTLNKEFGFTLDPCSTDENAKCVKHYTRQDNGLAQDWTGERVYCNPPYGREMPRWVKKCYEHMCGGGYCGDADTGQNGHKGVPRIYLRQGGNPLHQRPVEIRQFDKQCAVSVNGGRI